MDKVVNLINLTGWTFLLVHIELELLFNLQEYYSSPISPTTLMVLRAVQLLQAFDIVLMLVGISKGNIVASFFQIIGRNFVTLFVMEEDGDRMRFAAIVIIWSIADVNRYLYYLFKNNSITGFLRYNSFLILYPLGAVG